MKMAEIKKFRKFMFVMSGIAILFMILAVSFILTHKNKNNTFVKPFVKNGLKIYSKTEDKDFYVYTKKGWKKSFLKGVNMGSGKPGGFPGELAITQKEYLKWFQQIREMHVDVIRVYTIMKPDFYNALYEFNKNAKEPLYLMQGVWIDENSIAKSYDALGDNKKIEEEFIKNGKELVDIFHGNEYLEENPGHASGKYTKDISPYVIGWIMGVEWEAQFVNTTNNNHKGLEDYDGQYIMTKNASPFGIFLAESADTILKYEGNKYEMTRACSFVNWPTTDVIVHKDEPNSMDDSAILDIGNIHTKKSFPSGMFASFHVYPYYPEFMNYEEAYVTFRDDNGNINPYRAYLNDLIKQYNMPVLVAEFGIPSSRGKSHDNTYNGYNQGMLTETEQGNMERTMFNDIKDAGYCGAIVFSWQDEWFKKSWNTSDVSFADRRAYWSDAQTSEQGFGLLAFDPGKEPEHILDGKEDESKNDTPFIQDGSTFFVDADARYLHLALKDKNFDFDNDTVYIPIDTVLEQGNQSWSEEKISFDKEADFVIQIKGSENSRVVTDGYYNIYKFLFGNQNYPEDVIPWINTKNSGIFQPINLCLCRELVLPGSKRTIPYSYYETGKLKFGIGDQNEKEYNSLADFYYKEGFLEVRIPWSLLNFRDPSTKMVLADFQKSNTVEGIKVENINIGFMVKKENDNTNQSTKLSAYTLENWDLPVYHERLKKSYYILQKEFKLVKGINETNKK